MQNIIFEFLYEYYIRKVNDNRQLLDYEHELSKNIDNLFDQNKITNEESDLLTEDMNKTVEFVIKVISNCPFIEININQQNKQKE